MANVPKDELADAIDAAVRYGYSDSDFVFRHIDYPPLHNRPAPLIADVEVTHAPSGITETYSADSGSSWPADFAHDVEEGKFGVIIGPRRVRPWNVVEWVQVRSTGVSPDVYQVTPEGGEVIGVKAQTDGQLLLGIVKELRRRKPDGD